MVLNFLKQATKISKKLTDDIADNVVSPVSKQTDEALEESFFKIKDDVDLPEIKQTDQMLYKDEKISNVEYDKRIKELDKAEDAEDWQDSVGKYVEESRGVNPTIRTPELEDSTKNLLDDKITRKQHLANVDKYKPVDSWDALPREPSSKAVVFSLNKDQRKNGYFILDNVSSMGVNKSSLKKGDLFNGRLDIPAYNKFDTWVVTGSSKNAEKGKHYAKAVHYTAGKEEPVKFIASTKTSEKIGTGEKGKTPYATIQGYVKDLDVNKIRQKAIKYLNDPKWTQAGFDPRRQGGFYVRSEKNKHVPIREGSEVIQIGPLVLVKNAKLDFAYTGYDTGGDVKRELVGKPTKEKTRAGRTVYKTKEGERVSEKSATIEINKIFYNVPSIYAGKRYTDDQLREAIINNRIIPTSVHNSYKKAIEAAKKRSNELNKGGTIMKDQMEMTFMSEGGSFPDLTGDGIVTKKDILRGRGIDGFEEGGLRDEGGTVDPVSGNDVPSGSNKSEVRDDIPAMLSEGEFVFPADVVRYIGLSKLMELRQEAKMGLKVMEEMGQMGNSEEATLPDNFGIPDIEIIEDDDEELDGMDDDDDENDMDNMTESGKMMVMEKRAQGGVIEAQQGTVVPNQFEQMMGYGAGQGSTRYNANRVPYTKADGTIVNVLEDYMGRPMQDTEGLTRVTPYQAGPVFGGGVQPVQPIQPVLPPMPVDPTDDTAARREQERKDKRKEAKEADRRKALDAQVDKDIKRLNISKEQYYNSDADGNPVAGGLTNKDRIAMAKEDLSSRDILGALKTLGKSIVDDPKIKKLTGKNKKDKESAADRKRKRDAGEKKFNKETMSYTQGLQIYLHHKK